MLAVVEAVKYFSPYLYGQKFVVFTDHKPLCTLLTSDHLNGRLKSKLQPWMIKFEYLPGDKNTLADALSRHDWRTVEEDVTTRTETEARKKTGDETGASVVHQSGVGGYGGPAPLD